MKIIFLCSAVVSMGMGLSAPAKANEYCREYTQTIIVGGVPQYGYGQACFKPDGSWEIVDLKGAPVTHQPMINIIENDARNWRPRWDNHRGYGDYAYSDHRDHRDHRHSKRCKHRRDRYESRYEGRRPAYLRPIAPPHVVDLRPAYYPRHGYPYSQPPRGFSFTYRD